MELSAPAGFAPAAGFGRRLGAFLLDCVLSTLVAAVITRPEAPRLVSAAVLFLEYTFFVGVFARTPGMRVFGIGCVGVADGRPIGLLRAALRSVLLQLLVPAVLMDRDGRGLHDRWSGSVVVRG